MTRRSVLRLVCRIIFPALGVPTALSGQSAIPLAPERRVQITRNIETESGAIRPFIVHGRYAGFERNQLVITQQSRLDTLRIPYDQIAQVDIAQGRRHPFLHDFLVGASGTAVFGAALGVIGVVGDGAGGKVRDDRGWLIMHGTKLGAITGGSIGLIAAAIGRSGWVPFDKERLRAP